MVNFMLPRYEGNLRQKAKPFVLDLESPLNNSEPNGMVWHGMACYYGSDSMLKNESTLCSFHGFKLQLVYFTVTFTARDLKLIP